MNNDVLIKNLCDVLNQNVETDLEVDDNFDFLGSFHISMIMPSLTLLMTIRNASLFSVQIFSLSLLSMILCYYN